MEIVWRVDGDIRRSEFSCGIHCNGIQTFIKGYIFRDSYFHVV